MKRYLLSLFLTAIPFLLLLTSCEKEYVAPTVTPSRSLSEDFDTVANLYSRGWVFSNNSRPQGTTTWRQGVADFPAYSYKAAANEYIFVNFASGSGVSTLSTWMITPPIEMKNGDKFSFYTRTFTGSIFADRLQIRLNPTDNTSDVGIDSSSVGKFSTLLQDINSNLAGSGFPQTWTKYEFTISGLPNTISSHRIGFRYYVTSGGPSGANSNGLGIDKFEYTAN